jgi:RNA polymerase sigma-70 factor (ECF subfamily)
LDELEPERREVFVMFEIDERPMDEIARDLQVPLTTVVSRLRLARRDFEAAVRRITAKRHHQTAAVVAREVSR